MAVSRNVLVFRVLVFLIVTTSALFPTPGKSDDATAVKQRSVVVTVDYFDSVYFRTLKGLDCGPQYIADLTAELAHHGANTIVVRLSGSGLFEYDSKLSYSIDAFDVQHVDRMRQRFTKIDGLPDSAVERFQKDRTTVHNQFGKLIRSFDPRRTFVESGHKVGLKVLFWIDLFDDGYPGYRSKFIEENPECVWTTKTGVRHPSIVSYAFEKSRTFRVQQVRELLSSGADGIYLSTSAHSRHFYWKNDPGEFGFEAPVIDAYRIAAGQRRISTNRFDRELWHKVKGRFIHKLYEEISSECHRRSPQCELWIGLQLGDYTHITTEGNYTGPPYVAWKNNWRRLVDLSIADAFVLCDYEHPHLRNHPNATRYWAKKGIPPGSEAEIYRWIAQTYRPHSADVKLFLWRDVTASTLKTETDYFADVISSNNLDGPFLHEARDYEVAGMKWLKRMSDGIGRTSP